MFTPTRLRVLIIVLIALILFSCTASAVLGWRGGHTTRAASTFLAGLTFSIFLWTRLPKKTG